jgi:predicted house-cleaning noncanonical NTP pyrophosphatase (MazG superfamily)
MRKQCNHASLQEAISCRYCNPKRLSPKEYCAVLDAKVDPRHVELKLARILAELADLVNLVDFVAAAEADAARKEKR